MKDLTFFFQKLTNIAQGLKLINSIITILSNTPIFYKIADKKPKICLLACFNWGHITTVLQKNMNIRIS